MFNLREYILFRLEERRELFNGEVDTNFRMVANPWVARRVYEEGNIVYHPVEVEPVTGSTTGPPEQHLAWWRANRRTTQGVFLLSEWDLVGGIGTGDITIQGADSFGKFLVNSTVPAVFNSGQNALIQSQTPNDTLKLVAGTGIALLHDVASQSIRIDNLGAQGEVNHGVNIGLGPHEDVYTGLSGTNLRFKGFTAANTGGSILTVSTTGLDNIEYVLNEGAIDLAALNSGSPTMNLLSDVSYTGLANGDLLQWSSGLGTWVPIPNSSVGSSLFDQDSGVGSTHRIGTNPPAVGNYSTISGGQNNQTPGGYAVVSGGSCNTASGGINGYSTVSGGLSNTALGQCSVIGGGRGNTAVGNRSFIGGGRFNAACGANSAVSGGDFNNAIGSSSAIGGGRLNTACGFDAVIGGGCCNTTLGIQSVVGGGDLNQATGSRSTVGGGQCNTAAADNVTVGGGKCNVIAPYSGLVSGLTVASNTLTGTPGSPTNFITVTTTSGSGSGISFFVFLSGTTVINTQTGLGGQDYALGDTITVDYTDFPSGGLTSGQVVFNVATVIDGLSTISGGLGNAACGVTGFIGGGECNFTGDRASVVSGGLGNTSSGPLSSVGGGSGNTSCGLGAIIGGGVSNVASGTVSTVSGGNGNVASFDRATVGGGDNNTACGGGTTIGGGADNTASGDESTISGGEDNTASGCCSTIGGGKNNTAVGLVSTVSGGYCNVALCNYSSVLSGCANTASGYGSTIGGGGLNTTLGTLSTIAGGDSNTALGFESSIGGGGLNTAAGTNSSIVGGEYNAVLGDYSIIGGGISNSVSSDLGVIGGGQNNLIEDTTGSFATSSFIGGGECNAIACCYSSILGGRNNTVCHISSHIIGECITTEYNCTTHINCLNFSTIESHCGNAAAILAGLPVGQVYLSTECVGFPAFLTIVV